MTLSRKYVAAAIILFCAGLGLIGYSILYVYMNLNGGLDMVINTYKLSISGTILIIFSQGFLFASVCRVTRLSQQVRTQEANP